MNVLAPVPARTVEEAVVQFLVKSRHPVALGEVFAELSQRYPKYEVGPAIETLVFRGEVKPDFLWKHLQVATSR